VRALARWVIDHKWIVVVAWAIIFVAAVISTPRAADALSEEFTIPGTESTEADIAVVSTFGNGGPRVEAPLVTVVQLPDGTTVDTPGVQEELGEAFDEIAAAVPNSRAADYASTDDDVFVSESRQTAYGVIWYSPSETAFDSAGVAIDRAQEAAAEVEVAGQPVAVTGIDTLVSGDEEAGGPDVLVETLIGGVFALVVLGFVFGSSMALVPVLMAAISIPTTFLALWPIAEVAEVSIVVQFLVALIGLGIAIDYSLLIVMRWREERAEGLSPRDAAIESMEHAGKAVVFSGVAVAIGLLALIALPVPFLRSIGYGGMLIPVVSTLVAITLLPVILATIGPRLDRIGIKRRTRDTGQGWIPWGKFVVRQRWLVGGAALVILALLIVPVMDFSTGAPRADALSSSGSARVALDTLEEDGIPAAVLRPLDIVVSGADPDEVAAAAAEADGVLGAVAPDSEDWRAGDVAVVNVFTEEESSGGTVENVRAAVADIDGEILVGGAVATVSDFNDAVYGNFIWVLLMILVVTYVLLARAFRSLILPLKAVVFNVISIAAVWGFLVFFWQQGNGGEPLFGIESTGTLTVWIPLMVFAFLYGLSMDYEVFILSRMREEYDRTGSTDRAVVIGIARTGRLVTAGSLILFGAFVALASGPETDVKVFATALAFGILLDATVVRGMLLPAFVTLLGRWNWWLPDWAAKILRVEASHPPPEEHDTELDLDEDPELRPAPPAAESG
jgi:RND superfamily putative drug exporter